ncbi:MAG: KilA-N domain-containing protein [Candidatus Omnitrophota bacterium]|nr:KilA-N domain-containing protein [Candidatus Omnitrophota bacterium]
MAEILYVQGRDISIISREQQNYISLTDIAKYRNSDAPADIVKNWLRSRSTIEFLGLWEKLNNPGFKLVEFDQFRNEAGRTD